MIAADLPDSPPNTRYGVKVESRRRALTLAIILHIIVALLIFFQKREMIVKMADSGLKTFNVAPPSPKQGTEQNKSERKAEKKTEAKKAETPTPEKVQPPPPPTQPPPVVHDFQPRYIQLSSQDYSASNIGSRPSLKQASSANGQGDSKATAGPGGGPGGATLYPADWYREPNSTELGGYLKADMPRTGWGQIACRTVAQHHVEDCYILGESPRGSGFGRAVQNAAWQFLVLAPRVNGKEQIGTWVSIRITYTDGNVSAGG